jgi:hypothetical protein
MACIQLRSGITRIIFRHHDKQHSLPRRQNWQERSPALEIAGRVLADASRTAIGRNPAGMFRR